MWTTNPHLRFSVSDSSLQLRIRDGKSRLRLVRGGFTLIDGLLAAAVLGMATVAVVGPIMTARQQTEAVAGLGEALALARQLMEEIAAKPYADPDDGNIMLGPEIDETTRAAFDNVDDYHGYADVTTSLKMLDGDAITTATAIEAPQDASQPAPQRRQTFGRSVAITYKAGPSGPTVAAGDFATVRVSVMPVNDNGQRVGEGVELSGLVTRVSLKK